MSKAEERALEAYPTKYVKRKRHPKRIQSEKVDTHQPMRTIYIKGYHQAEKDLELTYDDICEIMVKPEVFLKALKGSDFFIKYIYTQGGCYQLYKVLKTIFPDAKPYCRGFDTVPHVATLIDGNLYDINGLVGNLKDCDAVFLPMTEEQEEFADKHWSFAANNELYYGECEYCGEPMRINRGKLILNSEKEGNDIRI